MIAYVNLKPFKVAQEPLAMLKKFYPKAEACFRMSTRNLRRAETLAEPYYTFRKKGYAVAFASVAGGPIPVDPYSLSPTIMKNHVIKTFMYDSEPLLPLHSTRMPPSVKFFGGHTSCEIS